MKIALYYPSSPFERGGIGNWIFEVTKRLSEKHEVTLVGLKSLSKKQSPQRIQQLTTHNVKHHEFAPFKLPIGVALPPLNRLNKLASIFNSSDVVYAIVPSYPTEVLLHLLKNCVRSKLIAGFHGQVRADSFMYTMYLPIFKYTLTAFQAYHTLNQQTAVWLRELGYRNVYCIPNGVDKEKFQLCEHPSKSKTFNLLYVGWLFEYKGVHTLLRIARYFKDSDLKNNIRLVICGSGPLELEVRKASKECGNIEYLNYVESDFIHTVYEKAHLFLLPSLMEGMPLSLLEAQSCGLPTVGSNIPGISEIIHGGNGVLADVNDFECFVNAIKKYYLLWHSSPEEYFKLNRIIREHAVRNYDWTILLRKFERMLEQTVSDKSNSNLQKIKEPRICPVNQFWQKTCFF